MPTEHLPDEETSDRIEDDKIIGEVFANRYQIVSRLGEGAMGVVYKAKHVKIGRAFAVKILHKDRLVDRKITQRFEREAELAGRLRHPNVIGVVDVGETPDGFRYMVMDFAQGMNLAQLLGEAPMPAPRIINLTRQILEGLYHAHEAGLIHRDFKPENVIIERDDHGTEVPRIVDFGIAILREGGEGADAMGRLTTNGLVLGTPHFMAPEQAVADPIDHRIDLFALGIVIYEMLCGELPFDGTGVEVARANLLLEPPLIAQRVPYLEVDPLLEAFSRLLMSKQRDQRPATAKVARELLDLIANDRVTAATTLGVSLASSRVPAITQPVTPQATRDEPSGKIARTESSTPSRATDLEAPRARAAAIARVPPTRAHIETDVVRPLPWASRRRTWIVVAFGAFSVAAIGIVIAITTSGNNKQPSLAGTGSSEDAPKLMVQTTVPEDSSAPPKDPNEPAGSAVEPAGSIEPEGSGKLVVTQKPPRTGTKIKIVKAGSGSQVGRPPIDTAKPPIDTGKPPIDTVPLPVIDAAALYKLYGLVGNDFAIAVKTNGEAVVAPLKDRYRMIQIQDAASTVQKRAAAETELRQLRVELAPLKNKL